MEPKLKDGQSRKVDPEEAIDTMARRDRISKGALDRSEYNRDDTESRQIHNQARNSRNESRVKEIVSERKKGRY